MRGGLGLGDWMSDGVLYATTDEGLRLPVIDVTNAAFALTTTEAELAAMAEQYMREAEQQREIPEALREALRTSMLGRGLMAASGTFLDGMSTYLLKLGLENLGRRRFRRLRRGCGLRTWRD